jgi:hypothetical protein
MIRCTLVVWLVVGLSNAHADSEGAAAVPIILGVGGIDAALVIHDVVVAAEGERSSVTYGVAETLIALPQLALAVSNLATGWNTQFDEVIPDGHGSWTTISGTEPSHWGARAGDLMFVAGTAALVAHGVWSITHSSSPRTAIAPSLMGDGKQPAAGLTVLGQF